ncbi:F-box/kelch-repeat protein SKIP6 [Capsella rubella]|nr:F-box/kelch-repeat protein SKIP6 [Capsella rubella]
MARSGASASLIDEKKIYVFGGCWDVADSSNWVEVYDLQTDTWEFLSVFTPKMPLKIRQSVVTDNNKHVHAVDEDGQIFNFSATECAFESDGRRESNPENRSNWLFAVGDTIFCRGTGGKILWRFPSQLDWKEVHGLEELQQQHSGFDIIKMLIHSNERMAILWEARPQGPQHILELWYAEISMVRGCIDGVLEVLGTIEWSGPIFSDSSVTGLNLLFAETFYL